MGLTYVFDSKRRKCEVSEDLHLLGEIALQDGMYWMFCPAKGVKLCWAAMRSISTYMGNLGFPGEVI